MTQYLGNTSEEYVTPGSSESSAFSLEYFAKINKAASPLAKKHWSQTRMRSAGKSVWEWKIRMVQKGTTHLPRDHMMSLTEGTQFRRSSESWSAGPRLFLRKMLRTHTGVLNAGTQQRAFQWSPREKRGPKTHTKVPNPYLAGTQGKEGRGSRWQTSELERKAACRELGVHLSFKQKKMWVPQDVPCVWGILRVSQKQMKALQRVRRTQNRAAEGTVSSFLAGRWICLKA